jgi:hypothetical protein
MTQLSEAARVSLELCQLVAQLNAETGTEQ